MIGPTIVCFMAFCLVKCLTLGINEAIFTASVQEKRLTFKENILLNIDANTVKYFTPKHYSTLKSRTIQDFKTKTQLTCFPEKKRCYLSKLNTLLYPDAQQSLHNIATTYKRYNKIEFGNSSVIYRQNWYETGIRVNNMSIYSIDLQDFHAKYGFPVYEVKPLPSNAKFLKGGRNHLMKRIAVSSSEARYLQILVNINTIANFIAPRVCKNRMRPSERYGHTAANGCDYLTFCDKGNCDKRHITTRVYYQCLCCPGQTRVSTCLTCTKL